MKKQPEIVLLVDTREQRALHFAATPTQCVTLKTGDYSVVIDGQDLRERVAIERKSIPDLLGCIGQSRARFEREIERLAKLRYAAIVVEGTMAEVARGTQFSEVHPASVMGSLRAWDQRYGVRVHFASDRITAAAWVRKLLIGFAEDYTNQKLG